MCVWNTQRRTIRYICALKRHPHCPRMGQLPLEMVSPTVSSELLGLMLRLRPIHCKLQLLLQEPDAVQRYPVALDANVLPTGHALP